MGMLLHLVQVCYFDQCLYLIQVQLLKDAILSMFGENPKESGTVARIVNKSHFSRLRNLLNELMVKETIVHGGKMDEDKLYKQSQIEFFVLDYCFLFPIFNTNSCLQVHRTNITC